MFPRNVACFLLHVPKPPKPFRTNSRRHAEWNFLQRRRSGSARHTSAHQEQGRHASILAARRPRRCARQEASCAARQQPVGGNRSRPLSAERVARHAQGSMHVYMHSGHGAAALLECPAHAHMSWFWRLTRMSAYNNPCLCHIRRKQMRRNVKVLAPEAFSFVSGVSYAAVSY